jgi:hypothetical protein
MALCIATNEISSVRHRTNALPHDGANVTADDVAGVETVRRTAYA